MATDQPILNKLTDIARQDKKGQGQTNDRLDALLAEQKVTNQWLAHIAQLLERQAAA